MSDDKPEAAEKCQRFRADRQASFDAFCDEYVKSVNVISALMGTKYAKSNLTERLEDE